MPQSAPRNLRTARTKLRPFRRSDVEDRAALGDDPEIVRMFGGTPPADTTGAMSRKEAEAWFEHVVSEASTTHWAIEFAGRFVGPRPAARSDSRRPPCTVRGFVEEGRERDAALVSGRWYDDVVMGILEHDWNAAHTTS